LAPAIWVVCIVVVALVAGVFNGFAPRTDQKLTADPGTPVPLGLGLVRVDSVTLKEMAGTLVTINGAVSNTSGKPLTASSFQWAVQIAYADGDGILHTTGTALLNIMDGTGGISPRTVLPPIPGFVPVQFTFMIAANLTGPTPVIVGLFPVAYTEHTVLDAQKGGTWQDDQSAGHYWQVHMTAQMASAP